MIEIFSSQFSSMISRDENDRKMHETFDVLKRSLQALPNLPMKIKSVHKTSDSLLRTSSVACYPSDAVTLLAPSPTTSDKIMVDQVRSTIVDILSSHHDLVIELESTSGWPFQSPSSASEDDDIAEVYAIKSSLLIVVGKLLKEIYNYHSIAENDFLDVFISGFVFRIRIAINNIQMHRLVDDERQSRALGKVIQMENVEDAVIYYSNLVDEMVSREPSFSVVCSLCKRWLNCHMLSGQLSPREVDLMVAYCFSSKLR